MESSLHRAELVFRSYRTAAGVAMTIAGIAGAILGHLGPQNNEWKPAQSEQQGRGISNPAAILSREFQSWVLMLGEQLALAARDRAVSRDVTSRSDSTNIPSTKAIIGLARVLERSIHDLGIPRLRWMTSVNALAATTPAFIEDAASATNAVENGAIRGSTEVRREGAAAIPDTGAAGILRSTSSEASPSKEDGSSGGSKGRSSENSMTHASDMQVSGPARPRSQENTLIAASQDLATRVSERTTNLTHGISIPDKHPRLWWNAERLARAQRWLKANPFNATSNFEVAWKHVVAGTSCASAIDWAMSHEVPYRQWQPKAIGSDEARWSGEVAIIIYDWCFDQLTTQQKVDFLHNVNGSGYGWNDYIAGINEQSWCKTWPQCNYFWGYLRNNIEYGIATFFENPAFAQSALDDGLNRRWSETFVPRSGETTGSGGIPHEGSAYGGALLSYGIIPFTSMSMHGRDIYNETDFFRDAAIFLIYATTPAKTGNAFHIVPTGDDERFVDGGILTTGEYYQDFMNFASNYWSSIDVGKYARTWVNTVGSDSNTRATSKYILAQDKRPLAKPYSTLPLDFYGRGLPHLYARKAWDSTSALVMFELTASTQHAHYSSGNFYIWRGGEWLTRESTGYNDSVTGYAGKGAVDTQSPLAHNTIVFETPLYGNNVSGSMPSRNEGSGEPKRIESAIGYAYAVTDMTKPYLWNGYDQFESGAVVHVERELLFLRDLEVVLVLDRLTTGDVVRGVHKGRLAADVVTTFTLHSKANPNLEDASHATLAAGTQVLRMTTLVPSQPTRRVINERCRDCSPGVGQYRIELDNSGAAQRYFLNVLQARSSGDPDISATVVDSVPQSPLTGTFTVTLRSAAGANTTVVFTKGKTSVGGTVDLAGAGPTTLGARVQEIRYTDSGPVWVR